MQLTYGAIDMLPVTLFCDVTGEYVREYGLERVQKYLEL